MYAKLFSSILDSSLWTTDLPTRILFLTMLAMADREGRIFASRSGLARRAVITDEQFERALAILEGPDAESSDLTRNPENNGRRIERAEGGWLVLNYSYYRDLQDADERRHNNRERQRRHREKSRRVTKGHKPSRSVTQSHASEAYSDSDPYNPLTPAGRGDVTLRVGEREPNPRSNGTNPRAVGTNPRAVGDMIAKEHARIGRPSNPGTIHSDADLSHFAHPPEPITPEDIRKIHELAGGNPLKPMTEETIEQRKEQLKAQARRRGMT